jgi:hypothetical protein
MPGLGAFTLRGAEGDEMAKPRQWVVIAGAALLAACVGGWWVLTRQAAPGLDNPAELTLYSIDGRDRDAGQPPSAGETFHGYPILGKVEVSDPEARAEITAAVRAGMADRSASPAACFWPRHGVRVASAGRSVDYVICFECCQLHIHEGDAQQFRTTSRTPQDVLNRHLKAAGVPLAPSVIGDKN